VLKVNDSKVKELLKFDNTYIKNIYSIVVIKIIGNLKYNNFPLLIIIIKFNHRNYKERSYYKIQKMKTNYTTNLI
jgi:hypothetical protein